MPDDHVTITYPYINSIVTFQHHAIPVGPTKGALARYHGINHIQREVGFHVREGFH